MDSFSELVILDARSAEAYEAGHLDGAQHADLETQLSDARVNDDPAHGGRHPLPPLEKWLHQVEAWGIGPSTRVVVYDDQDGANAAARAWWMLKAIGHENVEVLTNWREASLPRPEPGPADNQQPATRNTVSWRLPTVNMQQVHQLRLDPAWRVLDVRAAPRFRGQTEPIDPVAGHIPGAINLPFAENLEGGAFKNPGVLRSMYEELLGDVPPERLVVHCGSGVTACHTLLALDQAGLRGASLYVGSWGEWCRNAMPIATE
ncbi:MAG: sulfurtransferase [Acidobacteriota bacterium]